MPQLPRVVLLALITAAVTSALSAEAGATTYVQATVVHPNAGAGSLAFVTASGRSHVARAHGAALGTLRNLRPGDEVILTLEGPAGAPAVSAIKVSQVVPGPPPVEAQGLAGPYAWTQAVASGRPSWPNPYSRINPGLPGRPPQRWAAPRGTFSSISGGTLTVMPAVLRPPAPTAPAPALAPAVLTAAPAVPAPAAAVAPVTATRDESSTVDGLRAQGAREFEAAVTRLQAEARAVDSAWARYRSACPGGDTAEEGSREWFGLLDRAVPAPSDPACAAQLDEMRQRGASIRAAMLAANEAARRAWVLPGTLQEIRRRHHMEWSGWDR